MKSNLVWATEADIIASGCGYPEIPGYNRALSVKLSEALPFTRKAKAVSNGVVLGINNPHTKDVMIHDGPENVLIMGPPRSGKGINTIIPTCALWQRNLFCFEQYSDLWNKTADYREHMLGQRVLKFSPLREDSARWNPLGEVRLWLGPEAVSADIRVIADSIIYCSSTGLPVIDSLHKKAASFLAAIIAYLFAVFHYRGIPFMENICEFISAKDAAEIVALLRSSYPIPKWCPEATTFLKSWDTDEIPLDDLMQIVTAALTPYCNTIVQQNTRASDFRLMELIDSKEPLSIYYCLDGQWKYRGIASLFVNLMFYKLSLASNVEEHQAKCLMMLDDAIELSYLPQVESAFVISASYGVRICLVMQDYKQLDGLFGHENQIVQQCGVHVYFTPTAGGATATKISNLLGGNLMTPDDVLRLDIDKLLVCIQGNAPIMARKLHYYDHPYLKRICGEEGICQ